MKNTSSYLILVVFMALATLSSCEKRTYQTIEELDNENISAYIAENNLTVSRYKNTDLYYQVIRPGTGRPIEFEKRYPLVYTIKSLDGVFHANDTIAATNRYYDYMGYFPFGSGAAGVPNSPVERQDDLKYVIRDMLQRTNGQVRIIVPSRLTSWGRKGSRELGIPANASMDYLITVYDDVEDYEDQVIRAAIVRAGYAIDEFEKTADNIYYKIIQPGTGESITSLDRIQAKYILRDPAGGRIESSDSTAFNLNGGTITAWSRIIPEINVGGKIRLFTPSEFAYGTFGSNTIAPFLSLDFEVELIKKY